MKKLFAAVTVLFLASFFVVPRASAHATPISYEPEASSILPTVPASVSIHFSERIELGASNIVIFAPDGSDAGLGAPKLDPTQTLYSAGVKDSGPGTYTVSWQVVSADDGHFTKGAFLFSVGKETTTLGNISSQIQIQHLTSIPETTTIWIELLGQALLIAVLILWRFFERLLKGTSEEIKAAFSFKRGFLVWTGIVLVLTGAISFIVLKTFDLEELHSTDFITTLKSFIETTGGIFAVYRIILAIAFAMVFWVSQKTIKERGLGKKIFTALLAFVVLMLFSRTRVSHAAATHFYPYFAILVHTIHLFFKELWVGTLVVFVLGIMPILKKTKGVLASSLAYLSKLLSIAFGVIAVTGIYIVWLDLKDPKNLFTTEWGSRFIALSIFSGILLLLRLYHQFVADKAAAKPEQGGNARIVFAIPYSLALEMLVGLTVLFATSYIIITTPPFSSGQFSFQRSDVSQKEIISLSVHNYEPKEFLVTVVNQNNKNPAQLSDLIVTLTNQDKGIGPIAAQVVKRFEGGYAFSRDLLSPAGTWRVNITAKRPDLYDTVASFLINYPQEIEATKVDSDARSFGNFEWILLLMALIFAGFSFAIYRFSANLNPEAAINPSGENIPSLSNRLLGWPSTIAVFLGILLFIWFAYNNFVITGFQKRCEKDGNFWLQSVPLRNAEVLSSDTVTGCTLSVGLNHFADEREYAYFMRGAEAAADLKLSPEKPVAGKPVDFTVSLSAIENGRKTGPAEELSIEHDRIFHVLIVGEDLNTFAHIHSEDLGSITPQMLKTATFPVRYTFPKAGRYTIAVNYYIRAKQFINQFFVDVGGAPAMSPETDDLSHDKSFDGYHVTLDAPAYIAPNVLTKIDYTIEKDGKPVQNLEPYLSAAMHIGIIDKNLLGFIHAHGAPYLPGSAAIQGLFQNYVNYHNHFVPDKFGPGIQARITFPHEGLFEVFGEFKHERKIVVTSFMVKVGN